MAGITSIRIIVFLLSATCFAVCQQPDPQGADLPEAPSVQRLEQQNTNQTFQAFLAEARLPVTALPPANENRPQFGIGRLSDDQPTTKKESGDPLTRYLVARSPHTGMNYHASPSDSFMGRVSYAASSILVTHDEEGGSRLNTHYILAVLTSAAAHSAYRPYWRRSLSQPISDFGATIGNDAGMNVFHEFGPGIRQLLKSHEPKFVTHIEEQISHH